MNKDKREHYVQIRLNDEEKILESKFGSSEFFAKIQFIRAMIQRVLQSILTTRKYRT